MRRTYGLLAFLLVVAGGLMCLPGQDLPAQAESGGTGSGWVHYVYDKPGTPVKTGSKKQGFVNISNMGAEASLHVIRASCSSGTLTGGGSHDRFVVVGLRVANPQPGCSYSWTARAALGSPVFAAKVRVSELGFVAGRAEGTAKLQIFGDLQWKCTRTVAARDFSGGRWSASWPPSYTPPGGGETITYKKGEDKKTLAGEDSASGSDGHVQVRFLGRIHGEVMAHSQFGIDDREALSDLNLSAEIKTTLRGFTQHPAGPDGKPTPPLLDAEIYISLSQIKTPFVAGCDELEAAPDAPEKNGDLHDPKDFVSEDW